VQKFIHGIQSGGGRAGRTLQEALRTYEQTLQLHVAQKTLNVNETDVVDFVDFDY